MNMSLTEPDMDNVIAGARGPASAVPPCAVGAENAPVWADLAVENG
jgi:hypothetical protein